MKVRDFKKGFLVFIYTIFFTGFFIFPIVVLIGTIIAINFNTTTANDLEFYVVFTVIIVLLLSIQGFVINYTPLSIKNTTISIPARDQIRTFTDLIILNPWTGFYRRRKYNVNDIEHVANGYTKPSTAKKKRSWNVVITGIHNGESFSQKIDVSNKQVRDEIRNLLRRNISGKVSAEFSY